ncbi:MAG: Site-specific recombinase XerD [Thermoleophilia bacterium]|nr:Site-specific recombinase XerD [Thermoleophilia bacterium]
MSRPLTATKTPGVYRRGNRYVVVLRDRTGRQFKRSAGTLAEARVLKSTLSADLARGELQVTERMTFERYAREWVETYAGRTSRGIRPQTLADYRRAIERRAIPYFGRMQLADISARDIKRFAQELAAADLSANTIRLQLAPVKALLATAVEDGVIRSSPAAGVRLANANARGPVERSALTDLELTRLLAEIDAEHFLLVLLLSQTGLRIGEAVALQWQDVDLLACRIHVRRRYYKGGVDAPKSRFGIRSIPLSRAMSERLASLREGSDFAAPTDHLFCTKLGTPHLPRNILMRSFKPAAVRAGIPHAGFHTLRHTYASRLFRLGWNAKQVQMVLGHHSPAFTLATYVHLMPDDLPSLDLLEQLPDARGLSPAAARPLQVT